jgi:hypothetical protein
MQKICALLLACSLLPTAAFGYGSDGHKIVGAIADQRLITSAAHQKLITLLDGMTLRRAATIPDEIKTKWDKAPAPQTVRIFRA